MQFYCPVCDTLLPDTMICLKCNHTNIDVPIIRQRLVLEAIGCSGLDDIALAYRFIEAVADAIYVTLYAPPIVMRTPGQGITAVGVLLESHEILQTWPEIHFLSFSLESCREFDIDKIEPLIKTFFGASLVTVVVDSKLP